MGKQKPLSRAVFGEKIDEHGQFRDLVRRKKQRERRIRIQKWRAARGIVAALVLLALAYGNFGIARVDGGSMKPALYPGDRLVFWKHPTKYDYDDIVVLDMEDEKELLVKRVMGLPGDTIEITADGRVLRNGEVIRTEGVSGGTYPEEVGYPLTLGEGEYFVLGDNREVSRDSRSFGPVEKSALKGKALALSWRQW